MENSNESVSRCSSDSTSVILVKLWLQHLCIYHRVAFFYNQHGTPEHYISLLDHSDLFSTTQRKLVKDELKA